MPVVDDPDHGPGGRALLDAAGRPVGRYLHDERYGNVYADLFERADGIGAPDAAAAVLADLRGLRIVGDEPLGRELIAAGGRVVRRSHLLTHDLRALPPARPVPPGLRLTPVDRPAADLVDAYRNAYRPGHPDHRDVPRERSEAELASYLAGEFGPLLSGSGLAIARDGTVAGGLVLGTLPGKPPRNGPWVIDLFRDPAHRGAGRALLERGLALAADAGLPALGLIVTVDNPARGLYEALGFRFVRTALVVQV